jgi:hypothetical protein
MSRALAHRLRRLEERWALQMARRLETLPPLVLLSLRTWIVSQNSIHSVPGLGLPGLHLRGAAIVLHPHRTIEDQGCRPPACGACSPVR